MHALKYTHVRLTGDRRPESEKERARASSTESPRSDAGETIVDAEAGGRKTHTTRGGGQEGRKGRKGNGRLQRLQRSRAGSDARQGEAEAGRVVKAWRGMTGDCAGWVAAKRAAWSRGIDAA